jgi:glucose/arabinose dehydrogenase
MLRFKASWPSSAAVIALGLGLALSPPPLAESSASAAPRRLPPGGDCTPGPFATDTFTAAPHHPGQTRAPILKQSAPYRVDVILSGLHNPRALAFVERNKMLVSVWPGELRLLTTGGALSDPLPGAPRTYSGRDGAFDIALDPDFATNRTLYFVYRIVRPGQVIEPGKRPEGLGQVASARLSAAGDRLEDWKVIYEGGYLRRIAVARDGTLILTSVSAEGTSSRKLDDPDGKVLRINRDGSIPPDNPFVGRPGVRGEIYDLGHRDMDGIALDADGNIWAMEHGPRGGDEINRIEPGKDHGYPLIGYGQDYSGELLNGGKTVQEGMEQPVYYWSRNIAPAGMMLYSGKMFPQWEGDFFTGSLATRRLVRLDMEGGKVAGLEYLLANRCQRVRDVREAPDGSIYVLTNDMDSEKFGEVLRITAP